MLQELACRLNDDGNVERDQLIDDRYLAVLERLRQMRLLKKEDVQEQGLIWELCDFYPV